MVINKPFFVWALNINRLFAAKFNVYTYLAFVRNSNGLACLTGRSANQLRGLCNSCVRIINIFFWQLTIKFYLIWLRSARLNWPIPLREGRTWANLFDILELSKMSPAIISSLWVGYYIHAFTPKILFPPCEWANVLTWKLLIFFLRVGNNHKINYFLPVSAHDPTKGIYILEF